MALRRIHLTVKQVQGFIDGNKDFVRDNLPHDTKVRYFYTSFEGSHFFIVVSSDMWEPLNDDKGAITILEDVISERVA